MNAAPPYTNAEMGELMQSTTDLFANCLDEVIEKKQAGELVTHEDTAAAVDAIVDKVARATFDEALKREMDPELLAITLIGHEVTKVLARTLQKAATNKLLSSLFGH